MIAGVEVRPLAVHRDERGHVIELYREEWQIAVEPVQWTTLVTEAGVLRGMAVEPAYDEYEVVVDGRALVGLRDLRRSSPTHGATQLVELGGQSRAIVIPRGVLHGFYYPERTVLAVGGGYFRADLHLGCRWDDPELGIEWPETPTTISEQHRQAPSLRELLAVLDPWQAEWKAHA